MNGFRFRLAGQCARAVEHGDIERDAGFSESAARKYLEETS